MCFVFYAKIQDGHQKMAAEYTPWVKIFIKIALSQDKCIFMLYVESQNGHHKWLENDFWQKLPEDSMHTLWV